MKFYIAGPMRGIPNDNYEEFDKAEDYLVSCGHTVINPAKLEGDKDHEDWHWYLKRDIPLLVTCDSIALLPGALASAGACLELFIAADLDLGILSLAKAADGQYAAVYWARLKDIPDIISTAAQTVLSRKEKALGLPQPSILEEADRLVNGARTQDYGHPYYDFGRTAAIWTALLGFPVTAEQVGLCMVGVKLSRECHHHKRDNLVDAAGYLATVDKVIVKREQFETALAREVQS